jgi:hypothetical protein
MRVGNNPAKSEDALNIKKPHRVIVVFYIPDTNSEYFANLDIVLDKCLTSLINTINKETTNITLINNYSKKAVDEVVNKHIKFIDKYVQYLENKGKVYAVLNEARSAFEEFVTIADADILFYNGWENAVFDVFANHPQAGVVSPHPCPYITFYVNRSVFAFNSILGKIKYGKFVSDEDIDLYIKGVDLPNVINRNTKFNWKEKQFVLYKKKPVVIGAFHVVATYRAEQFRGDYSFPFVKFKNHYEEKFIDALCDKVGYYRLSTVKSYIYHMGNTIDELSKIPEPEEQLILNPEIFSAIKLFEKKSKLKVQFIRAIGTIFMKYKWKKS